MNEFECSSNSFSADQITELCTQFNNAHFVPNPETIVYRPGSLLDIESLFSRVRMMWCELEDRICSETSITLGEEIRFRREITGCVRAVIYGLQTCGNCIDEGIAKRVLTYVGLTRLTIVPLWKFEGAVLCKLSSRQMQHENSVVYQYFHTYLEVQWSLMLIECVLLQNEVGLPTVVESFVKDLVAVGNLVYVKDKSNPFLCPCVKKMWVCVHLLLRERFWEVFDRALIDADPLFSLWMLHHVAQLQTMLNTVTENHTFITCKLRQFLNSDITDEELIQCFQYLDPLLTNLWLASSKIEVYQIFWEHFNKHLNTEDVPKSASKLYELRMRLLRNNPSTSFEFFIGMLARHLSVHPTHWMKMKGRIYSRLSVQKLNQMDDSGLHKILLMFVVLSSVGFEETVEKLLSILEGLPPQRRMTVLVWNYYVVLILLHIENNKSITPAAQPLLQLVNSCSRDEYHLIRIYVNGLQAITSASTDCNLHQHLLLDTWVKNYMLHCQHSDLDTLLEVLITLVEKMHKADAWCNWEPAFKNHVLPSLKKAAEVANATPQIGKLAAVLCKVNPDVSHVIVNAFCGEAVGPRVSARFLCTFLQDYRVTSVISGKDDVLAQAWVRACLLTTETELARCVSKLQRLHPEIREQVAGHSDTLGALIEVLGSEGTRREVKLLFELLFAHLDTWVKPYVRDEALAMRIYSYVARLMFHCSTMLYCKTKSSCLFTRLVNVLLLPPEVLTGQRPPVCVFNAVQANWYLFVNGICNISDDNDVYVERVLRDLLVHYVPYFPTQNSPLVECFNDQMLAPIVLKKISTVFFGQSVKCTKPNVIKVLQLLDEYVNKCTSRYAMKIVVQKLLTGVLEFLLHNSQINAAQSLVCSLAVSPVYAHVREDVRQTVLEVTEKHLGLYATSYFELATILAKVIPLDMRALLPSIEAYIADVERKRGVGFDKMLRTGFANLRTLVL